MLTCPYCNAELDPALTSATCPRCGEKLPLLTASPPSPALPQPRLAVVDPARNRRTLRILLCVMLGVAALATLFILLTTERRRRNDLPHLELEAHPLPTAEDSATLGMLPTGCGLLGEVKLRQLLKIKPGAQLMKQPLPDWIAATVGKVHGWLGLKLGEIDDIALGMDASGPPSVWLIVETSKNLEPAWFESQYKPRADRFRGRPMYDFKAGPLSGIIWLAYKRMAIVQLQVLPDSLRRWDDLPEKPRKGLDGIDAALHPIFKDKRVEPEHLAWLAGTGAGLKTLSPWLQVGGANVEALANAPKAFSVGLLLRDKATISANFFAGDEKKSEALKATLEQMTQPLRDHVKIAGPQPGSPAAEQWLTMFVALPIDALRTGAGVELGAPAMK